MHASAKGFTSKVIADDERRMDNGEAERRKMHHLPNLIAYGGMYRRTTLCRPASTATP